MGLIRINRNPSRKQLAVFGLTWLVFFGAAGGIVLARTHLWPAAIGVWLAAVLVPGIGLLAPSLLRIVYLAMCYAAAPIGVTVSLVLLAVVYYGIVTPIGLVMRLLGNDPMTRRFDPDAETYWVPRTPAEGADRYFHQF